MQTISFVAKKMGWALDPVGKWKLPAGSVASNVHEEANEWDIG